MYQDKCFDKYETEYKVSFNYMKLTSCESLKIKKKLREREGGIYMGDIAK